MSEPNFVIGTLNVLEIIKEMRNPSPVTISDNIENFNYSRQLQQKPRNIIIMSTAISVAGSTAKKRCRPCVLNNGNGNYSNKPVGLFVHIYTYIFFFNYNRYLITIFARYAKMPERETSRECFNQIIVIPKSRHRTGRGGGSIAHPRVYYYYALESLKQR